jgi:hypothetical protein
LCLFSVAGIRRYFSSNYILLQKVVRWGAGKKLPRNSGRRPMAEGQKKILQILVTAGALEKDRKR